MLFEQRQTIIPISGDIGYGDHLARLPAALTPAALFVNGVRMMPSEVRCVLDPSDCMVDVYWRGSFDLDRNDQTTMFSWCRQTVMS